MQFMIQVKKHLPRLARRRRPLQGTHVYLASRFARQIELRSVADELHGAGATITSRWVFGPGPLSDSDLANPGGHGTQKALMDLEDLRRSNLFIAFTQTGDGPSGRGGRHAEFGIAIGLGIPVVVVGPKEHVFHCLPAVQQFPSWSEARTALLRGRTSGISREAA